MHDQSTTPIPFRRSRRMMAIGLAAVVSIGAFGVAVDAQGGGHTMRQKADVMEQGGGDTYKSKGATLIRTDHSVEVKWKVPTPDPGSYTYPDPAPTHPPIEPGHPEVFTLWMFVFDNPELCSDDVCDGNDVGDTPARGSVYQVDGEIADKHQLRMGGKVRLGQTPEAGLGLSNPLGAEIHVAMAPHGQATDGDGLVTQLNTPAGSPPLWFAAVLLAPGSPGH
ncbi:MAG: hypothetical protein WA964_20370 [Ilumatobacter sp.]|uniref:hypothetical protein n=1 Tax=Ilumatobacter sp. TaxID=1967498 RepID=UPI003C71F62D